MKENKICSRKTQENEMASVYSCMLSLKKVSPVLATGWGSFLI